MRRSWSNSRCSNDPGNHSMTIFLIDSMIMSMFARKFCMNISTQTFRVNMNDSLFVIMKAYWFDHLEYYMVFYNIQSTFSTDDCLFFSISDVLNIYNPLIQIWIIVKCYPIFLFYFSSCISVPVRSLDVLYCFFLIAFHSNYHY